MIVLGLSDHGIGGEMGKRKRPKVVLQLETLAADVANIRELLLSLAGAASRTGPEKAGEQLELIKGALIVSAKGLAQIEITVFSLAEEIEEG